MRAEIGQLPSPPRAIQPPFLLPALSQSCFVLNKQTYLRINKGLAASSQPSALWGRTPLGFTGRRCSLTSWTPSLRNGVGAKSARAACRCFLGEHLLLSPLFFYSWLIRCPQSLAGGALSALHRPSFASKRWGEKKREAK